MIEGKRYVDIDFDFQVHPVSGDLVLKQNEEAIKKSVKALILTNKYERPFQPSIDGRVRKLLFENMTPVTGVNLKSNVQDVLREHEPRIDVLSVNVMQNDEYNSIELTIQFAIKNQPDVVTLTTVLERTR
tara:strand:+ start:30 stop:419 length:390 start_codon:yes stop_codon:yes gene_type:complete